MRSPLLAMAAAAAITAACSDQPADTAPSENQQRWQAGSAVVVLTADVEPGFSPDVDELGQRPGVISASVVDGRLTLAFSRQAALVDLAVLRAELRATAGLTDVAETFTAPGTE